MLCSISPDLAGWRWRRARRRRCCQGVGKRRHRNSKRSDKSHWKPKFLENHGKPHKWCTHWSSDRCFVFRFRNVWKTRLSIISRVFDGEKGDPQQFHVGRVCQRKWGAVCWQSCLLFSSSGPKCLGDSVLWSGQAFSERLKLWFWQREGASGIYTSRYNTHNFCTSLYVYNHLRLRTSGNIPICCPLALSLKVENSD